ncbi:MULTISPECIES: GtrA family protein [Rhodomicrobium]|uniref:GtrA family protein n=1 Tax=Rhodomicrobium TaxID=1068 RepID=UPI000B4BE029|nr:MULTISPECIES: GtrA family protein [Rhodomicrobium]
MTLAEFLDKAPLRRQLAGFFVVGCAAALTHLSVVMLLVEAFFWPALVANIAAFAVAFGVSFGGHSRLTFPVRPSRRAAARYRFFVVAVSAFILNQSAYAVGLQLFGERFYLPVLFFVLLLVAAATFVASRLWAFAQPDGV